MLAILYINAFVAAYCNSLVNVVLVDIMSQFGVSATDAQWLVSGYTIVTAVTVMSMAFVYRRFSTQQIFYAAQALFIVSSIASMFAPSFPMLLTARLVQGLATGLSTPLMMNAVLVLAPPHRRGLAMGAGSTIITLGPAFSPIVSGILTTTFGWNTVFVVPLAVSMCLCVAGRFVLRNINERGEATFDVLSAATMAAGLTLVSIGLANIIADSLGAVLLIAAGAVFLAVFSRRQKKLEHPFLELSPLRSIWFWPCCLTTLAALMATFSVNMILPLYFGQGLGFTAFDSGLVLLVMVIFNTVTGLVAGALLDRFGAWPLIPVGFVLVAGGQVAICLAGPAYMFAVIVVGGCCVCAGVGFTSSPSQVTGLSSLEPELHPHGVSLMSVFIQMSGCIAPTLYVGVMNAVQDASSSAGDSLEVAVSNGMQASMLVAVGISAAALAISTVYTLAARRAKRSNG